MNVMYQNKWLIYEISLSFLSFGRNFPVPEVPIMEYRKQLCSNNKLDFNNSYQFDLFIISSWIIIISYIGIYSVTFWYCQFGASVTADNLNLTINFQLNIPFNYELLNGHKRMNGRTISRIHLSIIFFFSRLFETIIWLGIRWECFLKSSKYFNYSLLKLFIHIYSNFLSRPLYLIF